MGAWGDNREAERGTPREAKPCQCKKGKLPYSLLQPPDQWFPRKRRSARLPTLMMGFKVSAVVFVCGLRYFCKALKMPVISTSPWYNNIHVFINPKIIQQSYSICSNFVLGKNSHCVSSSPSRKAKWGPFLCPFVPLCVAQIGGKTCTMHYLTKENNALRLQQYRRGSCNINTRQRKRKRWNENHGLRLQNEANKRPAFESVDQNPWQVYS